MLAKILRVDVHYDHIVVRVTGTSYTASFCKTADCHLLARYLPPKSDHRAPMSQREFIGYAWQMANGKARELGWIV